MSTVCAKPTILSLKQCNDLKPSLQLADSGLTLSWLLNVLWENCKAFRSATANGLVLDVTCNDISEGKGYLSKVYETVLTLRNAGADSFTVMMKVPCKEVNERFAEKSMGDVPKENKTSLRDVYECHNTECKMLENVRAAHVPLPLPTVWYTQPATSDTVGAILMADLSVDNVCPGWPYPLTIKDVVRHFAAFYAHQACLGKEESAEAACPARLFWTEEFYAFLHNALKNTPEYEGGEFKRMLHQLAPAMTTDFFRYSLIDRPKQLGLPLVLLHGDAGPHNMFFKKNPDGSASSEVSAFIDWQIAFKGNQFFDITRNIYGFADAEARRESEETLLEDYYKAYKDGLSKKGRSITAQIDEFREPYALAAVHQALYAAMNPSVLEAKRHEYSPDVFDAVREKLLLRSKLALRDALKLLKHYAPQFIAE